MSLFSFFNKLLGKKPTPIVPQIIELSNRLQDADGEQPIDIKKIPRVVNPVLSYKNRPGVNEFEESEYDMAEIGRIEDVECIVQRAFSLKEGLLFKEGYELIGRNPETIRYIRDRCSQISQASGIPFDLTLHGIGEDLIRYHNSVLVKVRNEKASGGKTRTVAGKKTTIRPVAAYFSIPFPSVRFKRDEHGKVLAYRQQMPNGKYIDFLPDDIIHFYFRRKKGFLVGTPVLTSVKDDIRALRRIEENIEMLIYQNLFPLFQYIVGTENKPAVEYSDGTTEVDVVKANIEIMPSEGMVVTPERHEIRALGSEGRALRAEGYLEHFKKRIIGGLGISAIDIGEGNTANRSTADSMSRNLVDDVKYYQRVMEIFVNEYIIKELLLESTFENPLDEENVVRLEFREVDLDAKIKVENHAIQSFTSHILTHSEARKMYGKEPLSEEEWDDTYWKLIEEPMTLMKAVDEPYCYSEDTEILTENGWKLFSQLDLTDKVATLVDQVKLEFQKPKRFFSYDWNGEMYILQTRFVDLCTTPNHKLYVGYPYKSNGQILYDYSLRRADEVIGQCKQFKRGAIWFSKVDSPFITIPGCSLDINQYRQKILPDLQLDLGKFVAFLGWYVAEGYLHTGDSVGYRIGICQDREVNPEYYFEISHLLQTLGFSVSETKTQFVFSDKRMYRYLENEVGLGSYNKKIPSFLKKLSPEYIRLFIEAAAKGDGEITYHYLYSTVSKQLADDMQELALKAGWAATIRRDWSGRDAPIYRVAIHKDKYIDVCDRLQYHELADSSTEQFIPYIGKVYCVETETGIVYVRRNGKVCWCGNSAAAKALAGNPNTAIEQGDLDKEEAKDDDIREEEQKEEEKKAKMKISARKTSGQRQSASRDRPSNQHGRALGPTKRKSSFNPISLLDKVNPLLENYNNLYQNVMYSWSKGNLTIDWFRQIALSAKQQMIEDMSRIVRLDFRKGLKKASYDAGQSEIDVPIRFLENRISSYISRLMDTLQRQLENDKIQLLTPTEIGPYISSVFDSLRFRSSLIYDSERMKAYNYGVLIGLQKRGVEYARVISMEENCEDCREHSSSIELRHASIHDIPGFHPNCKCVIEEDKL